MALELLHVGTVWVAGNAGDPLLLKRQTCAWSTCTVSGGVL